MVGTYDNKELNSSVAIATTTFYNPDREPDRIRAELAKRTLVMAADKGLEVACVDGGSADEFLKYLQSHGVKVFPEVRKGMGNSRRQAIGEAYNTGRQVLVWTEPEKEDYIVSGLEKTVEPVLSGEASIVVAKRESLASYPKIQQFAEESGNNHWRNLTGTDFDMWFGVRVFGKDVAKYFLEYNGCTTNEGLSCGGNHGDRWASIFIPVMNAIYDGKRVESAVIPYTHPAEQTAIEESDKYKDTFDKKRFDQLASLAAIHELHWNRINREVRLNPLSDLESAFIKPRPEDGHEDERRKIIDLLPDYHLFYIKGDGSKLVRLGDHYHTKKEEFFVLVKGKARVTLEKVQTKDRIVREIEAPYIIRVAKGNSHTFEFETGSIFAGRDLYFEQGAKLGDQDINKHPIS